MDKYKSPVEPPAPPTPSAPPIATAITTQPIPQANAYAPGVVTAPAVVVVPSTFFMPAVEVLPQSHLPPLLNTYPDSSGVQGKQPIRVAVPNDLLHPEVLE